MSKMGLTAVLFIGHLLVIPAIAFARMEFSLPGDRTLTIEGTFWNQTLIRSDDFKLKFFNFNQLANGRVKLRGAENGLTNFENTENNLKWDHTDSNDENELREIYLDITMGRH